VERSRWKITDAAQLKSAADALLALPTTYYTGHCTGEGPFAALKVGMGDRLHALSTGMAYDI